MNNPPRSPQIGVGHQLAIDMMIELQVGTGEEENLDAGDCAELEPEYRHGVPYRNVVGEYLERARRTSSNGRPSPRKRPPLR